MSIKSQDENGRNSAVTNAGRSGGAGNLFSLMSAMFSIFVCSFRPGLTAVGMISQIVGLGMSFLCGVFIPQTMLGSGVLAIGKLFPVYWYVRATDLLSGAQTGTMTDVWICFGVLAGYILLFLLLTILKTAWHPRTQKNTKTAAVGRNAVSRCKP